MRSARITMALVCAAVLGVVGMSPASAAGTTCAQGSPCPSSVLDLANWKLTLPVDEVSPAGADSIYPLSNYQYDPWFIAPSSTTVRFRANAGGATTSGSYYPRSELRELNSDGTAAAWDPMDGIQHVMSVKESISAGTLSVKPQVVGAQIHDSSDDIIEIRYERASGTSGTLFVESQGTNVGTLSSTYVEGTAFNLTIRADSRGIAVYYNGVNKLSGFWPASSVGGWYFKAGAYVQSNTSNGEASAAYGEVVISSPLTVSHSTPVPTPTPTPAPVVPATPPSVATCAGIAATVRGTDGRDVLYGTAGNDVIAAGGGDDLVYGLGGNDVVCGGAGKDILIGGGGNDKLLGESDDDRLKGGRGTHDVCKGGTGSDSGTYCEVRRSF